MIDYDKSNDLVRRYVQRIMIQGHVFQTFSEWQSSPPPPSLWEQILTDAIPGVTPIWSLQFETEEEETLFLLSIGRE
jgi:hypothetical protein